MNKLAKRTLVILLALLPCISSFTANASTDDPPIGKPINVESLPPVRPRSIEPECYYLDGYVYIIGDNTITGICGTITRLSDNAQWSNSSSSNTLQIAVPTNPATYRLTFTMSDGSSYYGDYTLY
ncbi:MAG: hypothetical protein J5705_03790 [Bacteroidaceae bacterium]|nr:hypothetical protein [Bacteroidaceae bacterium]